MERILAALDDSDVSNLVLARAIELARVPGAKVRLLRAVPVEPVAMATGTSGGSTLAEASALFADATRALRLALAEIPVGARDGISVQVGAAAEVICAEALAYDADIVVIGAHRYGMFERVLGTTAAKVVNRLDRPVLVVRPIGSKLARSRASAELRREHVFLETSYEKLIGAYRSGDWAEVAREWAIFEGVLRQHMALEERHIFPAFRGADEKEMSALLGEHLEIRKLLDALGVGIDLHVVTRDMVAKLVGRLRAHATREAMLFYPWIDVELDVPAIAAVPTRPD